MQHNRNVKRMGNRPGRNLFLFSIPSSFWLTCFLIYFLFVEDVCLVQKKVKSFLSEKKLKIWPILKSNTSAIEAKNI